MGELISVEGVNKVYRDKLVLKNLEFKLHANQIALLIGPNGAGKSTLARLLLGIEKPTSGTIVRSRNIRCGYLPQRVTLNTSMSMSVACVIRLIGGQGNILDLSLLKSLNIYNLLDENIINLSGGQLQKVLIAANIFAKPNFLVLDEPMQGLDVESQDELHNLILRLKTDFRVAVLLISHDLRTVENYADHVFCLDKSLRCHSAIKKEQTCQDLSKLSIYLHEH
jgi:zinc transport system ATP-binding protein